MGGRRVAASVVTRAAVSLAAVILIGSIAACGGPSCDSGVGPNVCAIGPAIQAVQDEAGQDVAFYEISADADVVRLFMKADDNVARPYEYVDGKLSKTDDYPIESGVTFTPSAVDFDPNAIFTTLRAKLGEPAIVDFAITGGPNGTVVYDSQILSAKGGNLLVRLGKDGEVLGAQAD